MMRLVGVERSHETTEDDDSEDDEGAHQHGVLPSKISDQPGEILIIVLC